MIYTQKKWASSGMTLDPLRQVLYVSSPSERVPGTGMEMVRARWI